MPNVVIVCTDGSAGSNEPGARREATLRAVKKAGYRFDRVQPDDTGLVRLSKAVRRR